MSSSISTVQTGRRAEQAARQYLTRQGYVIVARNWRTRWCEIDLVAQLNGKVYFVEVKYRSKTGQGQGIDYITSTKLKQMRLSAQMWVHRYAWTGDYGLAAIGLFGVDFVIDEFVTDII